MKGWLLLVAAFLLWPGFSSQKACEEPDEIDFGEIVSIEKAKYLENDRVQYRCNPGYVLEGPEWVQCKGQEWTPHPPKCLAPCSITRQQLAEKNLFVFGNQRKAQLIQSNRSLQFQCNEGYVLVVPSVRKCVDGYMDFPLCISERGKNCSGPPIIENGDITTLSEKQYRSGSSIEFRCQKYYAMEGQNRSFCENGVWTKVPVCLEITCNSPRILNGTFRPQRTIYHEGDLIRIQCNSGFIFESDNGEKVVECTKNGWSPPAKCIKKKCFPPEVRNGQFRPTRAQYTYNEEIETICNEGFVFEGPGKVSKCTASGWNPPTVCKRKRCDYVKIENGRMTDHLEWYKPFPKWEGQSIEFFCYRGFLPIGKKTYQTATCIDSRFEPELKCFKICDSSQRFSRGRFISHNSNTYIEGDNITFACDNGYSPANQQSTSICTKTGWSPSPKCTPTVQHTCKNIYISHGNFESQQPSFQINAKVKYNCDDGYTTSEGETEAETQCLTEGWSPEPECIETCLKPPEGDFIFNTTKSVFFPGDKLHYECKEGFEITKNTFDDTIVCTEKGWERTPNCVSIICNAPFLENGIINPREDIFQHKMVVHFNCNEGFTRVGSESAQCYHFGWSPQPPICKENVKPCPLSPIISHGRVTGEPKSIFEHGDLLEVQCEISFALYGSKIIECVDGEWAPLPLCIEEVKTCGSPPTIRNGYFLNAKSSLYRHGETMEYKCQQRSVLIGTNPAKCLHGNWEVPSCPETCPPPPQLPNAINVAEVRTYRSGDEISFKCQEHFLLRGPPKIKCEVGQWQTPPHCFDLRCTSPPPIDNGIIRIGNRTMFFPGEIVEYGCSPDFELSQLNPVRCENRKWSELPVCKEKSCGLAPEIPNASLEQADREQYDSGKIINYTCNHGFDTRESTKITCRRGQWEGSFTCKDVTCPRPRIVENAEIVEDTTKKYVNGEKINYRCIEGFDMVGLATVTCRQNNWSPSPRCQDVRCSSPPVIQNGQIAGDVKAKYMPQEKAYYQCNRGYALLGTSFVTCSKKRWTQTPRCTDLKGKCGRPPPVENGDIVNTPKTIYLTSESVNYQCQNFYTMDGSPRVTCQNGHWSKPPTCKVACTASEDDMRIHNIKLRWRDGDKIYSADGNRVQFECLRGYEPHPNSRSFTSYCVDGQFDYPNCIPI